MLHNLMSSFITFMTLFTNMCHYKLTISSLYSSKNLNHPPHNHPHPHHATSPPLTTTHHCITFKAHSIKITLTHLSKKYIALTQTLLKKSTEEMIALGNRLLIQYDF